MSALPRAGYSTRASVSSSEPANINRVLGKSFTLAAGRTLGFHLYGAPDGIPVFHLHSVADSSVTLQSKEDILAEDLGIRKIAPDLLA